MAGAAARASGAIDAAAKTVRKNPVADMGHPRRLVASADQATKR
jgi:hypothetical protein